MDTSEKIRQTVSISAFVEPELRAALVERARQDDRSASSIVRTALRQHLGREASTQHEEQQP